MWHGPEPAAPPASPRNIGSSATTVHRHDGDAPADHRARFWNTALKLVMMAVMRSISRSSSSGIAITVVQNSTKAEACAYPEPTIRKPIPSGVVVTTSKKAFEGRGEGLEAEEDRQQHPHFIKPHPEDEEDDEGHPRHLPLALLQDHGEDFAETSGSPAASLRLTS
jgi:hypothetical protein